ncbi:hypothetical protein RCL1_006421 [Eukaryota sp. TZLM3-RCL]
MIDLVSALQATYKPEASAQSQDRFILTTKSRKKEIVFAGESDAFSFYSNTTDLDSVSLCNLNISSIGNLEDLSNLLCSVKQLDLSNNLLTWTEVDILLSTLTGLTELCLVNNKLSQIPVKFSSFPNVKTLILNNNALSWGLIDFIIPNFPNLKELFCVDCSLASAPVSCSIFASSLDVLDLSNNAIDSESFKNLSALKVTTLVLNYNQIDEILVDSICFDNLQNLYLGNNLISQIHYLSNLNHCPNLINLRVSDNPFVSNYPRTGVSRSLVIARIPSLLLLNGTAISTVERVDSERFYLNKAIDDLGIPEFSVVHPLYEKLVDKHGDPVATPARKRSIELVQVILKNENDPENPGKSKKLPQTMTLLQLKGLLCSLFGISKLEINSMKVFFKANHSDLRDELDNDSRNLSFFGLTEGEIIFNVESS